MKSLREMVLIRRVALMAALSLISLNLFAQARTSADTAQIRQSASLMGLTFTEDERIQMQRMVADHARSFELIRKHPIPNSAIPALIFNPIPPGYTPPPFTDPSEWPEKKALKRPKRDADLAFMTVAELSTLIKSGQVTSVELTRIYLERLKKFNDSLKCVVTLTEELALRQAEKADRELREGHYRGLLHGIPYGVKDLMAVPDYPTTWGAKPYKDQVLSDTAFVVRKLEEAGAVLVAKLTSGALAMGDVWFGGTTRNPWNLTRGSSGSSAGPASAMAAGLVAFSIGTETLGSIVSPSTRCGVTGLRPTFGRVGRSGTMALSWSMDKIGPICRTALDCAIVLSYIHGRDVKDPATTSTGFAYQPLKTLKGLRVGYLETLFNQTYQGKTNDSIALKVFKECGAELIPVELPGQFPVSALRIILTAEAAAAFDELTRSDRDTLLNAQGPGDWPNTFRAARFIPAVEYIQANRIREQLLVEFNKIISGFDLILCPTFGGNQLTLTNLTGHPCLVLPNGFDSGGNPTSISLLANLYREDLLCAAGMLYQERSHFYIMRPKWFDN